ncbi:MAG: hypothetical protein ACOC7K_00860 [bacterium]
MCAGTVSVAGELGVEDFKFDGPLGSAGATIEKTAPNHFKISLGHAPEHPDWCNMLYFQIVRDAKGQALQRHENIPFGSPDSPFPLATQCVVRDMDRDGDASLVMTENEIRAGRAAGIENLGVRGGRWTTHILPQNDPAERGPVTG